MWINQEFRLPDGRLIGWDQLEQYDPVPTTNTETTQWPTLPQITLVGPGTRYQFVALREVAALTGGTLVALVATAFIVARRHPG